METYSSTPFQTIDIWSKPQQRSFQNDIPTSMLSVTSNIIPSKKPKKTTITSNNSTSISNSISAGTSTIRKYLSTPDNILKLLIAILAVFILGFVAHYYLKTKGKYDAQEITQSCKSKLHEYCLHGTTVHNAQEVPVLSIYNGDLKKCETDSKLFHDRPLECQPNNKELLCDKIEEVAAQSNPEIAKEMKKKCESSGNKMKLTPEMGKCLDKQFDDIDDLNDCLAINKSHSAVGYKYNEFFPQKIKW